MQLKLSYKRNRIGMIKLHASERCVFARLRLFLGISLLERCVFTKTIMVGLEVVYFAETENFLLKVCR